MDDRISTTECPDERHLARLAEANRVSATRWGVVALELIEEEELTAKQLAEATGLTLSTVRGRLTRARKATAQDPGSDPVTKLASPFQADWGVSSQARGTIAEVARRASVGTMVAAKEGLAAQNLWGALANVTSAAAAQALGASTAASQSAGMVSIRSAVNAFGSTFRRQGLAANFPSSELARLGTTIGGAAAQSGLKPVASQLFRTMNSILENAPETTSVGSKGIAGSIQGLAQIQSILGKLGPSRVATSQLATSMNQIAGLHQWSAGLQHATGAVIPGFDRAVKAALQTTGVTDVRPPETFKFRYAPPDISVVAEVIAEQAPDVAATIEEEAGKVPFLEGDTAKAAIAIVVFAVVFEFYLATGGPLPPRILAVIQAVLDAAEHGLTFSVASYGALTWIANRRQG